MTTAKRLRKRRAPTTGEVIAAITTGPYMTLGNLLADAAVGRKRHHPGWVPIAYSALARHFGSFSRLDAELADGLWQQLCTAANNAGLKPAPPKEPFRYHLHAYWRQLLISNDVVRNELLNEFTTIAVTQARNHGLLQPDGPGSLTHPDRRRLIYGDGTIVRPRFRHRPDNPTARHDPSAANHQRHDGKIWGNNFVFISAREDRPYGRVLLALDRVPEPGAEAATAIKLIQHVHRIAGPGITAVTYDGAFQGAHHDTIMQTTGLVVINKPHLASRNNDQTGDTVKRRILGTHSHPTDHPDETCSHQLAAINGRIADVELADDGTPTVVSWAKRQQIKRAQRHNGTYRFNLALRFPCRHHNRDWDTWLSPHDDPENIRLLPPEDPDFDHLYGLRPDAESLNATFKATLPTDRAPSIGWKRQLYDTIGFAILHNSLAEAGGF